MHQKERSLYHYRMEEMRVSSMDNKRRGLLLLTEDDWGRNQEMMSRFSKWRQYPLLMKALRELKVDVLYQSAVHGSGHINRVLILAALIAWQEDLEEDVLWQYYMAVSYHDVGRYFDGLDLGHGARSALSLGRLTGYQGELLCEIQGAVAAHSQPDHRMEEIISSFKPANMEKSKYLTCLLKDADNLDRVRLGDLNAKFLRLESAKNLIDFSETLFQRDQAMKRQLGETGEDRLLHRKKQGEILFQ